MEITDKEFNQMRGLIYEHFGINLTEQKKSLLVSRLHKIMEKSGYTSFKQYYQHLENNPETGDLGELIDHISTNHTFFNREAAHFDYFSKVVLPKTIEDIKAAGQRDLRIWCAGCSSGQEPYMLLMLIREFLGSDHAKWDAGILATDISSRALGKAERGVYPDSQVTQLPDGLKRKYMHRLQGDDWEVSPELRKDATFRRFNLMNEIFPFKRPFHIIFCRNVMIYFDSDTRDRLVSKYHKALTPNGYLFLGHAESVNHHLGLFNPIKPAVYQKL